MRNSFDALKRKIHIARIKQGLLNALLFCAIGLFMFYVVLVGMGWI